MKKIIAMAIMMCLAISLFSVAFPAKASTELVDNAMGIDADVSVGKWVMNEPIEPRSHHSYWEVGDPAIWSFYDGFYGGVAFTYFTLRYADANVEIWVQNNLNWGRPSPWTGTFPYPPEWRTNPPKGPTDEQLAYLASEFGDNILPTENDFYGEPVLHDGSNANLDDYLGLPSDYYYEPSGREVILVCNIRDENYYLPNYGGPGVAYPYKIIGVHISVYEDDYYDRNVITVDAISFDSQCGPPGWTWPGAAGPVTSPYAYESTVAHERQHLLHHELCAVPVTFMNEGFSMYAEFLCGYGIAVNYFNSYFYTPDNSLTEWGDQGDINILADYGAASLWAMYLSDHFGPEFLQYYFTSGGGGIAGINAGLEHFGYKETFDDVYRDWKLANLIRADFCGCHKYNYESINFNDAAYIPLNVHSIEGLPVTLRRGTDFGNTITILGYDTGVSRVATYGSDYISFEDWRRAGFIYFDGDDFSELPPPLLTLWELTEDGWYSGTGVNLANGYLAGNVYVDPADPTLTLVTAYGLESYWDFGFVQVSTDGGATLTSLENEYTTYDHDPSAHPDIIASLPGFTDYSPDFPDWTTMTFDLTAYAGMDILVVFHYITDWATTYEGWWINSASVSGVEMTLANWTPPPPVPPPVSFQVTVVQELTICHKTVYVPYDMWLNAANKGMALGYAKDPDAVILIVTPITEAGMADYQFQATKCPLFRFF